MKQEITKTTTYVKNTLISIYTRLFIKINTTCKF